MGKKLDALGNVMLVIEAGSLAASIMGLENPLDTEGNKMRAELEEINSKLDTLIDLTEQELEMLNEILEDLQEIKADIAWQGVITDLSKSFSNLQYLYEKMVSPDLDIDTWMERASDSQCGIEFALFEINKSIMGQGILDTPSLMGARMDVLRAKSGLPQSVRYYSTIYWYHILAWYLRGIAVWACLKKTESADVSAMEAWQSARELEITEMQAYVKDLISSEKGELKSSTASSDTLPISNGLFSKSVEFINAKQQAQKGWVLVGVGVEKKRQGIYLQNYVAKWEDVQNGTVDVNNMNTYRSHNPSAYKNSENSIYVNKGVKFQEFMAPENRVLSGVTFHPTSTGKYLELKIFTRPVDGIEELDETSDHSSSNGTNVSKRPFITAHQIATGKVQGDPISPIRGIRLYFDSETNSVKVGVFTQYWQDISVSV
ncbi:hypothetical protein [Parasedimentitalea maritima]|nr:hypothetical protein [Zongyanglinia marina]